MPRGSRRAHYGGRDSGRTNTYPPRLRGEERASGKFGFVGGKQSGDGRPLLAGAEADETDQPGMRHALDDRQLAEILVDRCQDTGLACGGAEDLLVAGVTRPVA